MTLLTELPGQIILFLRSECDAGNTMKKGLSPPKLGDIYEITLSHSVAYAQYILRDSHPTGFGYLIRVLPGIFARSVEDPVQLGELEERFLCFHWLPGEINDKVFRLVASSPVPALFNEWPKFKDQPFTKWRIWEGRKCEVEDPLLPEHYDLSLMELTSGKTLISRIESGWHPRDEVFRMNPELRETYEAWKHSEGKPE